MTEPHDEPEPLPPESMDSVLIAPVMTVELLAPEIPELSALSLEELDPAPNWPALLPGCGPVDLEVPSADEGLAELAAEAQAARTDEILRIEHGGPVA